MVRAILAATLLLATVGLGGLAGEQARLGKFTLTILDGAGGQPVPCRLHVKDAAGKPQRVEGLPFFRDHFVCPGKVTLELPAGDYHVEIERGPEYASFKTTLKIDAAKDGQLVCVLERRADLAAAGWWSGELHVHRPLEDIELLMRAEDLHVAPVITWWNKRNLWSQRALPAQPLVTFDGNRAYHVLAGEDEREGGALLYFGLAQPLAISGAGREYPSPLKFVAEARRQQGVWIDVEKPFWWDVPVWLASGQVDSIGLANNHMCRSEMYEGEAWGKPRVVDRLPPPRGNGFWSQEIYYHILNCGLRIPPSAGSASGVLPNPLGYNRVYVHLGSDFSYEKWWEGLRAGRSFVTNGPLLKVEAAGKLPGHVFTAAAGQDLRLDLKAELSGNDAIRFVEIVKDGQVERRVPIELKNRSTALGTLTFQQSGWFLVRAVAENPKTFRFASTAPYYVEIGATPRVIHRTAAQFFLDWVRERTARVKVPDAAQREEVLQHHRGAEKFWQDLVAKATAD